MTSVYSLKREDTFFGKKLRFGETSSNTFARLGKKDAGVWIRPVHEVWEKNGQSETLHYALTHNSAETVAQFVDKLNDYTTRNAQHLYGQKTSVYWWHLIAYPLGKFLQNYIVKRGFLDGMHGFVHACFMSFHSFLTRGKLWLLYNR